MNEIITPRQAAHIAHVLTELLPEEANFVLSIIMSDGTFETLSTFTPREAHAKMMQMAEVWSPVDVDTFR